MINITQDWLLPVATASSLEDWADASTSATGKRVPLRMPRDLFEYQP